MKNIAANMLEVLKQRLSETSDIKAYFTDAALNQIAAAGFDPLYGARPLRRAIQSNIEDMLAEKLLDETIKKGQSITIDFEDGKFIVK